MFILICFYIFLLGAGLGSFALVVSDRWQRKESWVKGRSHCDSCKKTLKAVDLIPIASWLIYRRKCRQCGAKIPSRYPLVELLSGSVLLLTYIFFPVPIYSDATINTAGIWVFAIWLAVHTLLTVLVLIDLDTMLLPYVFLATLAVAAVLYRIGLLVSGIESFNVSATVLALVFGGGLFAILWLASKGKWIGDSDVILGGIIGIILAGPIEVWVAYVSASILGLVYALMYAKVSRKHLKGLKIPFGPFLIAGLLIAFLFSAQIIDWYTFRFLIF